MRSKSDASKRWNTILTKYSSAASLKDGTAQRDGDSPCEAGLRSICWRIFLLYPDLAPETWITTLRSERKAYAELHSHHLRNFEDESLFEVPDVDPLAEDESNPYEMYRRDEELRQEILQDVERCMPENTFFREPHVQNSLLEILFIYCKLNQDVSYRQGFHELAAVMYWVVACDAITPSDEEVVVEEGDEIMLEALDARFIDHDAFSLFQCVMRAAKQWYELGEGEPGRRGGSIVNSPIVMKSKHIHETLLMTADPELAERLKELDVLPQVFLIRWIRLLFGREFPFEELLTVWDVIFAEDPDLHLVDLICVSMLLRIRWKLVKADYSTALTLLLRYPSPSAPYGPVSFVEDAKYLRDNLSTGGGKYIITKYSKRAPEARQPRPSTQKPPTRRTLSPSNLPLFQTAQIESIVQDVAKNVLDRSEKWGVNRAVREAVVEVKKNVQGYQPKPLPNTKEEELERRNRELTSRLQKEEERRRQLARILDTSLGVLQTESIGQKESDDAFRRITHVKECLLDDSRPLDKDLLVSPSTPTATSPVAAKTRRPSASTKPTTSTTSTTTATTTTSSPRPRRSPTSPPGSFVKTSFKNNSDPDFISLAQRPRVTLAQSSFAWMLGDEPISKHRSGFVAAQGGKSAPVVEKQMEPKKGKLKAAEDGLGLQNEQGDTAFDLRDFRKG